MTNRKLRHRRHDNGPTIPNVQVRTDAGPSAFLTTELEFMLAEVYREDLPALRIFDFVPVSTEVPAGAETITYRQLTPFGAAHIIRQPSQDIPRVDIFSTKFTSPVYEAADAYGFTLSELESAAHAGMPLETERANLAREAMARLMSDVAINGGAAQGVPNLPGILSNGNIPVDVIGGGVWAGKTAAQVLSDMTDGVTNTINATNGIEVPDTMLLPIVQYEQIANLQVANTNETVLTFFLRTNPHINRIDWLRELGGSGPLGQDQGLVYKNDPSKLKYHMPLPFQQRPAQEKNLDIVINCREKTGGVVIPKPLSLRIMRGV